MRFQRFESVATILLVLVAAPSIAVPSLALAQNRLALSQDGRVAAYAHKNALWVVSTAIGGKPRKVADIARSTSAVPRWSPSGDRLAYYSHQSGSLQLWLYDLRSESSRQISFVDGGINPSAGANLDGYGTDPLRYSWSPDGSKIVFASEVIIDDGRSKGIGGENDLLPSPERLEAGEPIVLTSITPRTWTLYGVVSYGQESSDPYTLASVNNPEVSAPRTTQLFLLDVESGKASQLTHDTAGYFTPEWSPDGKRLAYMSAEGQALFRGSVFETNIFTFDLATRKKTKVTQGRMRKTIPRWSPDGGWIAYYGKDITETFVRKNGGIYVVRSDDGSTSGTHSRDLTSNMNRVGTGGAEWSPDGSAILTWYVDGLGAPLVSVDATTAKVSAISLPDAVVGSSGAGVASSRGGVIWTQLTDPNGATTLWFRGKQGRSRVLLEIEPAVDLRRSRRWEIVQWTNRRGENLEGILIYPFDYAAQKQYPVVVDMYGLVSKDRGGYDEINYVRASSRYFIFRPNHRAPHMYTHARKSAVYDAAAVGPMGIAVMADDVLTGVDMLIERRLIDSTRMCVAGFSNGALQGAQLITETGRFKCAVLQSGNYDWITYAFLSTDPSDSMSFTYRIAPWEDSSIHIALSPVFHADKITTPLLLAVGDREPIVIQSVELYNVLRYLKKEVTLLRYPKQGHGLTGAAQKDFAKRIESFFVAYLERERSDVSRLEQKGLRPEAKQGS